MNVYVVYCHPLAGSYTAAMRDAAVSALAAGGHDVRLSDLYADGFSPEVTADAERGDADQAGVAAYLDNLGWCEALVLVYPTWWSGQPAMLKGWFDRVLVRGSRLRNVRRIVAVTSHGSAKHVNMIEGEGGKRVVTRTLRSLCHPLTRTTWLSLYGIDRADAARREAHLRRIDQRLRRI